MKKIVSLFYRDSEEIALLNERAKAYAKDKGIEYVWVPIHPFDYAKAIEALADADAGIIDCEVYDKRVFSRIHERNKLLIRYGVGYDAVNLEDATACGVRIARTQGANAVGVAEMAMMLILSLKRKLLAASIQNNGWSNVMGHELTGSTVGILGFGAVGQTLAKMLKGFDCRILAYDKFQNPKAAEALGAEYVDLDVLFRESDAISIHAALNEETAGVINSKTLGLMKPEAVLVNTSRGGVVKDEDLVKALAEKKIGGAGLDVFNMEPLPADSPYLKLDNVILTSHIASSTVESFWKIYESAIDIAENFFAGREDPRMLN